MITLDGKRFMTADEWKKYLTEQLEDLTFRNYMIRAEIDKLDVQQTELHHRLKWLREQLENESSTTEEK